LKIELPANLFVENFELELLAESEFAILDICSIH